MDVSLNMYKTAYKYDENVEFLRPIASGLTAFSATLLSSLAKASSV